MRDSACTTSWSDTLTFRINYQDTRTRKEPKESGNQPSASDTGLIGRLRDDCRVMKLSSRSLAVLRSLPPTSLVLLLTPVLTPATNEKADETESTDPFEEFGRELSKMHRRLRHVPYVPKVGMTETHVAFIEQAAAVIVVICEPADPNDDSLDCQRSFAGAVAAKRENIPSTTKTPFVLVRFDADEERSDIDTFDNVLHAASLTKRTSSKATQLLFEQEP